jgi:HD-GYP domain-containing protein (c-di-GMP phosphodiesterase class II)
MHHHPAIAAAILRAIQGTEEIAEIVLAHHERLNGSGYPRGLREQEISLEARVLSVADVFCALTEERPYHAGLMDAAHALAIIEPMGGRELDEPTVRILKGLVIEHSDDRVGHETDVTASALPELAAVAEVRASPSLSP